MSDLIKFAGLRILIVICLITSSILIYQFAEPKFNDDFWSFIMSISIPLLVLGGAACLVLAKQFAKDHAALCALNKQGSSNASDWEAISGQVKTDHSESDEFGNLAAFRYQITDEERSSGMHKPGSSSSSGTLHVRAEGYFQKPMAIKNDSESINIRGFLDLRHLERESLASEVLQQCHAAAIRHPKWIPKVIIRKLAFTNVTDKININWIFRDDNDGGKSSSSAKILRDGDQVIVFGRRHNDQLFQNEPLRQGIVIYRGTNEELTADLRESGRGFRIISAIALLIAAGLSLWLLFK